ncbi:hypothetical protein ACFLUZ_06105 [Chloroflexota bacterium]
MTRALFVFTPAESKRLIGKAVAQIKEVKHALQHTSIMIGHGSTNVYVLEELLGKEKLCQLMNPTTYLSGILTRGTLCSTVGKEKPPIVLLKKGVVTPPPATMSEMLHDFEATSVVIKGANAVDPEGNAGALVGNPEGGTIGWAISSIIARGICLIVPVGLEKLIPSVKQAASSCGQYTLDYVQGKKSGMIPLTNAKVVTEIEALKILTGVDAFHVASGGVSGSEGSVSLVAQGDNKAMDDTIKLFESIKGEEPLNFRKGICESCEHASPANIENMDFSGFQVFCRFRGKTEEELPAYLRNR